MTTKALTILFWITTALLCGQNDHSRTVMRAEALYANQQFIELESLLKPLLLKSDYLQTSADPSKALIYYFKSLSTRDQQTQTLHMASQLRGKIGGDKNSKQMLILDFYEACAQIVLQHHEKGRFLFRNIIEHKSIMEPTLDSLVVKSHANIAVSFHMEGLWQEAEAWYNTTMALLEGDPYKQQYYETRAMVSANYLNLLFDVLKRYRDAGAFLKRMMNDPRYKNINLWNHHLFMMAADYFLAVGEQCQFMETAKRLEHFYQQQKPVRHGDLGYLYLRKALHYSNMGNTTKSILLAQQSEKLLQEEEGQFNYLPDVYEILARNHALSGDDHATIHYINKLIAANRKEKRYAAFHPYIVAAKHYANLELHPLAACYADSGRAAYLSMGITNEYDAETYHGEMARINLKMKQGAQARHHLNKLEELFGANLLFDQLKRLEVETGLAYCDLINSQPSAAIVRLNKIRRELTELQHNTPDLNPASLDKGNINRHINILSAMAWLQLSQNNGSMDGLNNAWHFYQLAIRDLEHHLCNLNFDVDRISFTNIIGDFLSVGYSIAQARHENHPSEESVIALLAFSQKEKGFALQASINSRMNKIKNKIDPALIKEEEMLMKENSYLMAAIRQTRHHSHNDSAMLILLQKQKVVINKLDTLHHQIKARHPHFKQCCLTPATKNLRQIQQTLDKDQAVIDYFIHKDACTIILVQKDTFEVKKVVWDKEEKRQLRELIQEISTPFMGIDHSRIHHFKQCAGHIHNRLIAPLTQLRDGSHLVIIPHGELFSLPFEVLAPHTINKTGFRDIDYLIRHHPVSYCASLSMVPDHRGSRHTATGVLAFAPDYSAAESHPSADTLEMRLSQLPGARKEIDRIAKHYPVELFTGKQASKAAFINSKSDGTIIHLAMHALANHTDPMESGLVFTGEGGQYEILKAYEIYNMHLEVPMLALNACNTGSGKYIQGEGVMSLARAFQFAGVKSILTTLWPVNDRAGISIMDHFYSNLKAGCSKHESLRKSKVMFLEESDNIAAHPYYWACYSIVGDTRRVEKRTPIHHWVILTLLMVIPVMTWRLWRGTRKGDEKR